MLDYSDYIFIIQKLKENHGLVEEVEHKHIHTMREGTVDLFRLLYGYDPDMDVNKLYVSFHLDVTPVDAILWFQKICNYVDRAYLAECYYQDDRGETYVGVDAEAIRLYKQEQLIISNWEADKEETEKFLKAKIVGRPAVTKNFHNKQLALEVFNIMKPNDDETQH